jgi:hypothetical protein
MGLAYEHLMGLKGVDAWLSFGYDCDLLDTNVRDSLLIAKARTALQELVGINGSTGIYGIGPIDSTVLLSEKGAWYFTKVTEGYLVVLAGAKESVDVAQLCTLVENIKEKAASRNYN